MPKIILTRHGLTDYNAQRRYQGQSDIPLNETGLQQAEALRKRLTSIKIDAAYCSALSRARVTAEVALKGHPSGLKAEPLTDLREVSGGVFEGLNWEEMNEKYPEEVKKWRADRASYPPPEGESLNMALERIQKGMEYILSRHPGEDENILVVAHGGVGGLLMCYFMGMDLNRLWQWRFDTCSLTILDVYKDASILSLFNDTTHLDRIEEVNGTPLWKRSGDSA